MLLMLIVDHDDDFADYDDTKSMKRMMMMNNLIDLYYVNKLNKEIENIKRITF